MNFLKKHSFRFAVLHSAVTLFLGCESNFKEVQKSNFSEFVPSGEAEKINLKYTDSGRITAVLVSPKMMEYANVTFPFTDFPKGIDVTLYDKNNKRTIILADFATSYKSTNIIDLKGNVKITSQDGQILETDQLYFDQKNEWFFTEKSFKFTDPKGTSNGQGIDFSKDFKVINSQKIAGEIESDQ
ncbi:LPS export ABC transporter periplasmic protein LptC [Flavobacterium franklandianum]|uniref:LPS export ABC transporter periplasmic protein LptC n=1 Tax=Flavobacterium franklandianum TaxID=2594430 RepID=A0A553CKN6_9FLAO|nr:LPS export ABC transporter periplasmic protein LptC [Flavobacterium franklandianum]TRX21051.1 LPS export ABC transporter periplasmic protein LptC [Flavobacterium franklandianum]TRX29096.1 LPS export ABC transporter periplasmic protein LptC [Flavobacterium franklandianum]